MTFYPKIRQVAGFGLLALGLLLRHSPALAQQTTGTVTGVVEDASGAIVPQATVVLTNLDNKSERKTVSNAAGEFTIASASSALRYQIKVSHAGFTSWESQVFPLRPGDQIAFTDVKLQIGSVSEQVTVEDTASQALKPLDSPERSDVITAEDLNTLAIEGRDATELIRTLPGFALVSPGLTNTGNNDAVVGVGGATTGAYSSNGQGVTGTSTILDGVSLTDIGSNSGTTQTINAEMITDMKVTNSNFGAEVAHGPTIISATTKAGTSAYHGSGYFYARDTVLNANDWYNNFLQQARPEGRYFFPGGTIGGPLWIPHTGLHRDTTKLFFFAGFEYYNQLFSPETLGAWVPTMAERTGDFSAASLDAQLCGARPDGAVNQNAIQPMCNATNYLPNGAAVANGNLAGQGNSSGIALLNWLPLPNADPFTNNSGYNYVQEVLQQQNGSMLHTRVDYAINDNNKLNATFGLQKQVTQDPVAFGYAPTDSVLYPGQVTSGDISNIFSLTYTRVFSPTVVNEFNGALSLISDPSNEGNPEAAGRFTMNNYNCNDPVKRAAGTCGSTGNGNFNYLGEFKNAGDYSVPALSDYSNLGYPNVAMAGGFYNKQVHLKKEVPDFQDTVTWQRGPHTLKFGVYYEKGILNGLADPGAYPQGEYSFNPQTAYYDYSSTIGQTAQFTGCENPNPAGTSRSSGAAYLGECITPDALMYLGYADTYTQTNFSPDVDMQYTTLAGFVNDSWKVTHRVTLQLGARIEHLGPWVDRHNNGLATFSPTLYNAQCAARVCGSQNDPGITWHGINPAIADSVNNPATVYFSPRLGMAWDIFGTSKTVLRGGWGVYRHQEEFNPYALAGATAQGYKTTFQQGQESFDAIDRQSPVNPLDFSVYTLSPTDTNRPIYYEYNGAISQTVNFRHLKSLVEVAYVGNNSQHLGTYNSQASGYNAASDLNIIPAGFFFGSSPASQLDNLSTGPSAVPPAPDSLASLTTAQDDFYRPYPFYNHIYSLSHTYYSNYNSLQVSWNKAGGIFSYGTNYTFSKNLATAASYNNTIPDPLNLRNEYNPTPYDRTQVFNIHYLLDLGTRYHGDRKLLSEGLNGWQVSGISSIMSGPPLASIEGENFGFGYGQIQPVQVASPQQASREYFTQCTQVDGIPPDKNGNHFCVSNVNPTVWLGSPDYLLMPTVNCKPTSGLKSKQYINPTCFGIPLPGGPTTGSYANATLNPSGQGQYRLPYIHGPGYSRHDLTVLKNFPAGEKRNLQFRLAAFNFLNHPLQSFNQNDQTNLQLAFQGATAGQPLTVGDLTNKGFGTANVKYGSRLVELSVKFSF
jgi:hypothetical protein